MRTAPKAILTIGLLAVLSGPLVAQTQLMTTTLSLGIPVALLGFPAVQKELKLDETQIRKSEALIEATRVKFFGIRDRLANVPLQERRTKQAESLAALNEESMKDAGEFLKAEQHARLYQLEMQRRGSNAFSDTAITTKLGFTDDQIDQVKTLFFEQSKTIRALQQAADEKKADLPRPEVFRRETLTRVIGIMTDAQRKRWNAMTGDPLDFNPDPPAAPALDGLRLRGNGYGPPGCIGWLGRPSISKS